MTIPPLGASFRKQLAVMFATKRCHFALWSLAWLLLCGGCANLKPSAAQVPPDDEGGLAISDESRSALGFFGTCAYFVAEFFGGGGVAR